MNPVARTKTRIARLPGSGDALTEEIGHLIEEARRQVAVAANAALTGLYWEIGRRMRDEVLAGKRAEYGAGIVATVGRQLEARYGRGFGEKSLRRMVQFAETFTDPEIVAALRRQLGWAHFKLLIPMKDGLKRDFYAEMCRVERWSTRQLAEKIDGMLYERTALSKKPEELYLRWLDRHERQPGEEAPLGIILCAGKKRETAHYLDLDGRGIHVAEYLTELPPREVLAERLHRAIAAARERLHGTAADAAPEPPPKSLGSPATEPAAATRKTATRRTAKKR